MYVVLITFNLSKIVIMIKAINIQKKYGELQVLKGVDIQIDKGELFLL